MTPPEQRTVTLRHCGENTARLSGVKRRLLPAGLERGVPGQPGKFMTNLTHGNERHVQCPGKSCCRPGK